ncbi:MAG: hypothetical protein BVN35_20925 [Proteobacteria bacterium ST_bin11]|nr:MAG: hypothetical protein BVN35_20925 [Proteobacteria bacterium ST_bin11]
MGIFDNLNLNAFARYDEGLSLPDEMTLGEIAIFWATPPSGPRKTPIHDDGARWRVKIMLEAFKSGKLVGIDMAAKEESEIASDESRGAIGSIPFEDSNRLRIMREVNRHIQIKKADFIAWLESENQPFPYNCQLEKWWIEGGDGLVFSIDEEEVDRKKVQKIGKEMLESNPGMTCTEAKKRDELKPFYKKYPGKDPVKVDDWLKEIGMLRGKRGRPKKYSDKEISSTFFQSNPH